MENKFKGIWLERMLWLSQGLTSREKLTLAVIEALDNGQGCYASNDYLGAVLCKNRSTISESITRLRDKGYIVITKSYKEGSPKVTRRSIRSTKKYLNDPQHDLSHEEAKWHTDWKPPSVPKIEKNKPLLDNQQEPSRNQQTPLEIQQQTLETQPNLLENQSVITKNITKNNKVIAKTKDPLTLLWGMVEAYTDNQELKTALVEFLKMRKKKKSIPTEYALKKLLNRLDRLSKNDDYLKLQIVDKSVENNWTGFFELRENERKEALKNEGYRTNAQGQRVDRLGFPVY